MSGFKISAFFDLAVLLLFLIFFSSSQQKGQLTQEQAVRQAEKFIIDNGYTSTPANKSQLSYELFDNDFKSIDALLTHRHNTLLPQAFCINEDKQSWHIGFLASTVRLEQLSYFERQGDIPGRAVIVLKNGKEVRIAHKEPLFSHFIKL